VVSGDKMMIKSRGPVWHKKQKDQGIIPKGLRGIDRQATWCYSAPDGWIYGHGSFCLASHGTPVLGIFAWMPNSASEAKRLEAEITDLSGLVKKVCMDSKADDQTLYYRLKRERHMQLLTVPRRGLDKSATRRQMIRETQTKANRRIYRQRMTTVEPMQGLVKELFDLESCWMRGNASNRWLFAAMGVAVQMAQHRAYRCRTSTWKIKREVLGV